MTLEMFDCGEECLKAPSCWCAGYHKCKSFEPIDNLKQTSGGKQ